MHDVWAQSTIRSFLGELQEKEHVEAEAKALEDAVKQGAERLAEEAKAAIKDEARAKVEEEAAEGGWKPPPPPG